MSDARERAEEALARWQRAWLTHCDVVPSSLADAAIGIKNALEALLAEPARAPLAPPPAPRAYGPCPGYREGESHAGCDLCGGFGTLPILRDEDLAPPPAPEAHGCPVEGEPGHESCAVCGHPFPATEPHAPSAAVREAAKTGPTIPDGDLGFDAIAYARDIVADTDHRDADEFSACARETLAAMLAAWDRLSQRHDTLFRFLAALAAPRRESAKGGER